MLLAAGCSDAADDPAESASQAARVDERAVVSTQPSIISPTEPIDPLFEQVSPGLPRGNFAAVEMGDINKDGYAEIVSGRRDGQQGLFLFSYDGQEWTSQQIASAGEYGGVAVADVTGDGILDVLAVTTVGRPNGLEVYKTTLSGRKMRLTALPSPLTNVACDDLAVADIESDGDMDIAASTGGKGVRVLVNDGHATFRQLELATETYEDTGVAFGDVNHDGRLDVIASNHPGENLRLFLCAEQGDVRYDGPHVDGLSVSPGIGYRVAVADFNADRFNDLAVGGESGVRMFLGNGCKGDPGDWWKAGAIPDRGHQTMQVDASDLNRDGRPDLAFSSGAGIFVLLSRAGGGFSQRLSIGLPDSGEFSGCRLFDWDGDGDLDLACASLKGLGVRFYRNKATGE